MGLVDLHFHESTFEFAPHVGPKEADEERPPASTDSAAPSPVERGETVEDASSGRSPSLSSRRAARGVGALVALAVLVGIGVLVRKAGGGEADADEEEEAEVAIEEEI